MCVCVCVCVCASVSERSREDKCILPHVGKAKQVQGDIQREYFFLAAYLAASRASKRAAHAFLALALTMLKVAALALCSQQEAPRRLENRAWLAACWQWQQGRSELER